MDSLAVFIEKAKCVDTQEALCLLFEKTLNNFGFQRWAYSIIDNGHVLYTNYAANWVTRYLENHYEQIDPLLDPTQSNVLPFLWSNYLNTISLSQTQLQFFDEAKEFSLEDGIAIPIHDLKGGFASVTLVSDMNPLELSKLFAESRELIYSLALTFHSYMGDLKPSLTKSASLTPREKECLQWSASGKSSWDISQILKVSERTVVFHIENAKKKFNVRTRQQAIVQAISSKEIQIEC